MKPLIIFLLLIYPLAIHAQQYRVSDTVKTIVAINDYTAFITTASGKVFTIELTAQANVGPMCYILLERKNNKIRRQQRVIKILGVAVHVAFVGGFLVGLR